MDPKNTSLMFKALLAGVVLNFIFPFTYTNGGLFAKKIFSIGNPALILPYAILVFILFSTVSQKDIDKKEIILLDKPKNIPKTVLRSILEITFGIIFILLVPLLGGLVLFLSGVAIKSTVFICIAYIAVVVFLCKKFYWKN